MDTSSYELSDLEDIEFFKVNSQVELDAVFRSGIDTLFHQQPSTSKRWGKQDHLKNPCVLDKEEDNENSPPTTPVSERPTETPKFLRNQTFGRRIENVPEYVYRTLFDRF